METHTSPRTGTEYLIAPQTFSCAVGGVLHGVPLRPQEYTQYDILLNGNRVQFCFRESDIASTVEHYENPGPDLGSVFD